MKNKLLQITYLRRKERLSLFAVSVLLVLTSFMDELYFLAIANSPKAKNVELVSLANTQNDIASLPEEAYYSSKVKPFNATKDQKITYSSRARSKDKYQSKVSEPDKTNQSPKPKAKEARAEIKKKSINKNVFIQLNHTSKQELTELGLSDYVSNNWIKYQDAGGKFYQKEDILKVYGLDSNTFHQISAQLQIKSTVSKPKSTASKIISVNNATAEEFQAISGIGPVLSKRIVKYRDKLGGFYKIDQLKEVYGIDTLVIDNNKANLKLDSPPLQIHVNLCSEEELSNHPYCSYQLSKTIVNFRKQHGVFSSEEDLLKIRTVSEDWIRKMRFYLDFEVQSLGTP